MRRSTWGSTVIQNLQAIRASGARPLISPFTDTTGFDPREKHQSQIPALQLLVSLGFSPLSQDEALRLRGGRLQNVVLDDVLDDQLMRINRFSRRGRDYAFDLEDAHEAMRRLKPTPDRLKGLRGTNQDIYDTLVLGTTITKAIDGDSKSYSFRFIDWENPENNVFHVTLPTPTNSRELSLSPAPSHELPRVLWAESKRGLCSTRTRSPPVAARARFSVSVPLNAA